jgi:secreted trypsin-like serine protease
VLEFFGALSLAVSDLGGDSIEDLLQKIFTSTKQKSNAKKGEGGSAADNNAADDGVREPPELPSVVVLDTDTPSNDDRSSFVMGGVVVADATAPWQAQIYYPEIAKQWKSRIANGEQAWILQHYCGGALIGSNWIVTAAHCIDEGMMKVGYRIRLGQERIDRSGGWSYKIDRVVRHPDYKPLMGGDIALIHFVDDKKQGEPRKTQVRPISLFRGKDLKPSELVTAYGWGRTSDDSKIANAILMRVSMSIVDRSNCAKANLALVDWRVVCAKGPGRKTCSNDSGGPLINSAQQVVGLVSVGSQNCKEDGLPGVYTRIGAYLPWIDKVTAGAAR